MALTQHNPLVCRLVDLADITGVMCFGTKQFLDILLQVMRTHGKKREIIMSPFSEVILLSTIVNNAKSKVIH